MIQTIDRTHLLKLYDRVKGRYELAEGRLRFNFHPSCDITMSNFLVGYLNWYSDRDIEVSILDEEGTN